MNDAKINVHAMYMVVIRAISPFFSHRHTDQKHNDKCMELHVTYDIFKKGAFRWEGQLITSPGGSTFHRKHAGGDRDVVNTDKKPPKYGTFVATCTLAHSISSQEHFGVPTHLDHYLMQLMS